MTHRSKKEDRKRLEKDDKMDQEGNMNSKFKQVLHLHTAGVWGGKHADALWGSLKVQAELQIQHANELLSQPQCNFSTLLPPPANPWEQRAPLESRRSSRLR